MVFSLLSCNVFLVEGTHAQESPDTSQLADVLQTAVRHSPELQSARIDLDIAEAQVQRSMGIDDMLFSVASFYTRGAQAARNQGIAIQGAGIEASIGKAFATGGSASLTASLDAQFQSQLAIQLQQPLLRDRGSISRSSQKQAKLNASAASLDLQARARDEIRGILDAYWELVWAHNDVEIRKSGLALTEERRRLTKTSIRLGSAPSTALVAVEQVLATNEEDILLAEQRVTERSLELRRLAGLPIDANHLDLRPEEELRASPKSFEGKTVVAAALSASPELAAIELRGKSAAIAVDVAVNGITDRLDFSLNGGIQGIDPDSLSGAIGDLGGGYFVDGRLRYERSIGANTANGATRDARARRQSVAINKRILTANIATAATRAVQSARIAAKRIELSSLAIELSEKNIRAEQRRFDAGKATNFDVLQRQEEQKQARLRRARAVVDYLRATIAIQSLNGTLLDNYGIVLDPVD